jgi:tetratricopeptide (TPR) repeat protein
MFKDACRKGSPTGIKILLLGLGGFLIMLLAGCSGGRKNQLPPRLAEVKRQASEGSYWFRQGCFSKAERSFYQALEASRLVDNLAEMVRAHNNLGAVALAQDHYLEAGEHLQKALELNKLLQSEQEESLALGNLGVLAYKAERYEEAEELWERALVMAEKNGQKSALAINLNHLGMLKRKQERLKEAELLLQRALAIGEGANSPLTLANSHMQLGLVARVQGDLTKAEEQLTKALEIDKGAENTLGIAEDLEEIGLLRQEQQLWEMAYLSFDRAINLYAIMGKTAKVNQLLEHLKTNQAKGGVPESLVQYEPLLVRPGEYWESPLCR